MTGEELVRTTPKKSGDAKWYSLQTNLGSRRVLLATVYSPQMRVEASALA